MLVSIVDDGLLNELWGLFVISYDNTQKKKTSLDFYSFQQRRLYAGTMPSQKEDDHTVLYKKTVLTLTRARVNLEISFPPFRMI